MAYRLTFWINNGEEILELPHVPPDFPLPEPDYSNETYEGLSRCYTRIGIPKLRQWSWKSFILQGRSTPRPWYSGETVYDNAMDYIDILRRWRDRRVPVRMFLTNNRGETILNVAVTIDKLDISIAKTERLDYEITVTEYNFVID